MKRAIVLFGALFACSGEEPGVRSEVESEASAEMALLSGVSGRINTLAFYSGGGRHPGTNAIDVGAGAGAPVWHQVDYVPASIAGGWIWVEEIHEAGFCSQWWPGSPYYNGGKILVYTYFFDVDGNDAGWHRAAYQHVSPNAPSIDRWWRWNNAFADRPAWDDAEMTLGDQSSGGLYLGEVFGVWRPIFNGPSGGLCTDGSHLHQEGDGWRAGVRWVGEWVEARYNDLQLFVPSTRSPPPGAPPWRPLDRCAALGYHGACSGSVLEWCDGGELKNYDCATSGQWCGWQDDNVGNNCL